MNVLIIGGSNWLGKELALSFAKMADNIFLLARSKEKLDNVANLISEGTNVYKILCNLGNMNDVESAINFLNDEAESIDLVLNVAGGTYVGGTYKCKTNDFIQMFDAYIKGQLFLVKSLIPLFRKSGDTLLVNFLSDWSVRKSGMECGNAIYTTTKTALATFTDCLISEENLFGLKASNIYLGEISEVDVVDNLERDENGIFEQLLMKDICLFVEFFINSESLHVTDVILAPKSPGYARSRIHTNSPDYDV